jgi:hypothetical protein
MKPVRWSRHALESLKAREIDGGDVEAAIEAPDVRRPGQPPRTVLMRRYLDRVLGQEMLLRVIIEETDSEVVVVTAYRTSQFGRYLKGGGA